MSARIPGGYLFSGACPDGKAGLVNDDLVHRHAEHRSEYNDVVEGGHCVAVLPLVDGLRRAEAEYGLKITYRHPGVLTESGDVSSSCGHVDDRYTIHFIYAPVPALSRNGTGSVGLEVIDGFQYFDDIDALGDHADDVLQ